MTMLLQDPTTKPPFNPPQSEDKVTQKELTKHFLFQGEEDPEKLLQGYLESIMGLPLRQEEASFHRWIKEILNSTQAHSDFDDTRLNPEALIQKIGLENAFLLLTTGDLFASHLVYNDQKHHSSSTSRNVFKNPLEQFLKAYPSFKKENIQNLKFDPSNLHSFKQELVAIENLALQKRVGLFALGSIAVCTAGGILTFFSQLLTKKGPNEGQVPDSTGANNGEGIVPAGDEEVVPAVSDDNTPNEGESTQNMGSSDGIPASTENVTTEERVTTENLTAQPPLVSLSDELPTISGNLTLMNRTTHEDPEIILLANTEQASIQLDLLPVITGLAFVALAMIAVAACYISRSRKSSKTVTVQIPLLRRGI